MEKTFCAIKPDATSRGLVGEILARFERLGFKIKALKMTHISQDLAQEHYGEHKERPFFGELVAFITSGPVVAFCLEGENCIEIVRKTIGATDPVKAAPGSIRGDYCVSVAANAVHASDSPSSAARELALFFPELH